MLTDKDYCDYDTCVALKELGCIIVSSWFFNKDGVRIPRTHLYDAQKWLREEKKIEVNAFYDNTDAAWRFYILEMDSPDLSGTYAYNDAYMSYEEALLEGIKGVVKLLKED